MIKKYKHISFDLDGTLVHTLPEYRYKIVPKVVNALGGKIKNSREIDKFWFEGYRDEIIKNEFGLEPEKFWTLFRQTDSPRKRSENTFAYQDVGGCLIKIKALDKKISVITNAPHSIAEMEISKLNGVPIDFYFPIRERGFDPKPSPAGFSFVFEEMGIGPKETVYIGNSSEDAHFAKNAGVDFIYLERKQHEFDSMDWATKTIYSLDELFV